MNAPVNSTSKPGVRKPLLLTAALGVVSLSLTLFVPLVFAQFFSPGKLSKVHSHLSGLRNCKKCHVSGRTINSQSCLNCHTVLAKQVNAGRGYHGRMNRLKLMKCARCHTEHKGRKFKIVYWEGGQKNFNHNLTGYTLHHKHANVDCRKCHTSKFIQASAKRYFVKWKRQHKTFLGLPQSCQSCHKDPHRGQVSKDCKSCHSEKGWKKAHRFNHAKTKFPLRNKHSRVDCVKCHKPLAGGGRGALQFKVSTNCQSCHKDPHAGKMTVNCKRCHSDAGWETIAFAKATHAPRRFRLNGAHFKTDCKSCHGPKLDKSLRTSCVSCHKTPHPSTFSTNCVKCHNTTSWFQSKFSRAAHAKTRFPLLGQHEKVPCAKCHKADLKTKAKGKRRFKMEPAQFADCTPCHKDVHNKQFKSNCKSCHNEQHFRPSLFGVEKHAKTKFPLRHAHLAVPCASCHKKSTTASKDAPVPYHFANQSCKSCHQDPHQGRYNSVIQKKGCQGCHSEKAWTDVKFDLFSHNMTSFALTGKHQKVKCNKCHVWKRRSNGRVLPHYKLGKTTCRTCHSDIHYGQFDKGGKQADCETCHTTKAWIKATRFSHDKARFKLTGAHKKVACTSCHKKHKLPNQKKTTLYRPIKHARCINCHNNYHNRGSK